MPGLGDEPGVPRRSHLRPPRTSGSSGCRLTRPSHYQPSWSPKDPPPPHLPIPASWKPVSSGTAKARLFIQGQRVNPGSCSPTQGGSSPSSCSSRPENTGPARIKHQPPRGGQDRPQHPQWRGGGLFFWKISKVLQKRGCRQSPGLSCLSLSVIKFKKPPLGPRAGGGRGL